MANQKFTELTAGTPISTDIIPFIADPAGTPVGKKTTVADIGSALNLSGKQNILSEGAFIDGDKTKLDGIEASADVTDTTNVTSAGALMDSEVTNLADVKAFDPTDYATSTQGSTADSALQPSDIASGTITARADDINFSGGSDGDVLTVQADGSLAVETPTGGGTSVPKIMWTTDFSSTTRFNKAVSGGTNTFGTDGLVLNTTSTTSRWAITRFDWGASWGGGSTFPIGSPSFSSRFYISVGSDMVFLCGIGEMINDTAGGSTTCTSKHIGFKITRTSSGDIELFATQANGTTESATKMATVATANEIEVIFQVNGSSSVDYYYRVNGGALSSATNITTNMPTTAEAWVCWGINNRSSAADSSAYIFNGSFQR